MTLFLHAVKRPGTLFEKATKRRKAQPSLAVPWVFNRRVEKPRYSSAEAGPKNS
jgi:hypothetical protein